jgi:uncharacterized membrane protein YbhN (UPF0104 family)
VLATLAIGLSVVFVAAFVRRHWQEVTRVPANIDAPALAAYLALTAAYFTYQGLVWWLMYRSHGHDIGPRRALALYLSAILLAYVPGKVAAAVGIAALARENQVPVPVSVYLFVRSQLMFLFLGVAAAAVISLFLPPDIPVPMSVRATSAIVIVVAIGIAIASRGLLRRGLTWVLRLARADAAIISVSRGVWLRDAVLLLASWFLHGTAFWWLVRACAPATVEPSWSLVTVTLIVSYVGAFLAVFVPAGLGVLEAELIFGLGRLLEPGAAVWVAVGHRLLSLAVVAVMFGVLTLTSRRPRGR